MVELIIQISNASRTSQFKQKFVSHIEATQRPTDSSSHAAASDDTALATGAPAVATTMTAAVPSMMSSMMIYMMRPASVSVVLPASMMSKMSMLPASL
jgi:hypothetical protein